MFADSLGPALPGKLLIRAGQMNVSQIAAHLNYSSVQQFSRQFKTKFGVSPNEFAKSIR